jgi:hypothetical protein
MVSYLKIVLDALMSVVIRDGLSPLHPLAIRLSLLLLASMLSVK